MGRGLLLVGALVALYFAAVQVEGKKVFGTLNTNNNWNFLSKFCFDNTGEGKVTTYFNFSSNRVYIAFYNDLDDQWAAVHTATGMSCRERLAHSEYNVALPGNYSKIGYHYRVQKAMRQRWWYIVLSYCVDWEVFSTAVFDGPDLSTFQNVQSGADCERHCYEDPRCRSYTFAHTAGYQLPKGTCSLKGSNAGVLVTSQCCDSSTKPAEAVQAAGESKLVSGTYTLDFRNGGTEWDWEFSYDEQGLLTIYIVFYVIFLIGGVGVLYFLFRTCCRRKSLHPLVMLLMLSYLFLVLSTTFFVIYLAEYAKNGFGMPGYDYLARVCQIVSNLLFMLVLFLIAKGWTITTSKLSKKRTVALLYAFYVAAYVFLFIWETQQDPATVLYLYESPPGMVIIGLHIVSLLFFGVMTLRTFLVERSEVKRRFYLVIFVAYSIWFLCLPFTVLAAHVLSPWVRRKTVDAIIMSYTCLQYLCLPALAKPAKAYEVYHSEAPAHRRIPTVKQMGKVQPSAIPDE